MSFKILLCICILLFLAQLYIEVGETICRRNLHHQLKQAALKESGALKKPLSAISKSIAQTCKTRVAFLPRMFIFIASHLLKVATLHLAFDFVHNLTSFNFCLLARQNPLFNPRLWAQKLAPFFRGSALLFAGTLLGTVFSLVSGLRLHLRLAMLAYIIAVLFLNDLTLECSVFGLLAEELATRKVIFIYCFVVLYLAIVLY